jgi:SAM-dependent methyltransferase
MWVNKEFVNPFDQNDKDFWIKVEHIGRYNYAIDVIQQKLGKNAIVADMGCAVGYGTQMLSAIAKKVVGFDFNKGYLEISRQENMSHNTDYRFIDLQSSPKNDISEIFDCIVAFEVLEHLYEASTGLAIFNSALIENGLLICSVPNDRFEGRNEYGKPSNEFHKRIYTKDEIVDAMKQAGFEVVEILGQYLPNVLAKKESKLMRKRKEPMFSATNPIFRDNKFIEYFGNLLGYPTVDNIEESYSYVYLAHKKQV